MDLLSIAVAAVIAVLAALVVGLVLRRSTPADAPEAEERLRAAEAELARLRDGKAEAERRLAIEEQKASRLTELTQELAEKSRLADLLKDQKAAAEAELAAAREALANARKEAESLADRLAQASTGLEAERRAGAELKAERARLQETLEQERRKADEKLALLTDAKERMTQEFKLLADEVMKRHGESFAKQNKDQMDLVLSPLRQKLAEFQQGLQAAQTESAKERATLAEQIRSLSETSAKITSETHNLTKALKGDSKTQGAWGEMVLARILEQSGLREGEEYVTQESHNSEEGARLRPDVIVNLPGGQRIVIDSKVSLTAFESFVNAESDVERAAALARHLSSLRAHIKTLGSKDYQQAIGSGLDYVIMFVPIEGALAAALQQEPDLTAFAAANNVTIGTPTTLMMALRTVSNVWQVERRNRNADAIAQRAGALYDKFVGFVGDMQKLGSQFDSTRKTYDAAMNKLTNGTGNLVRQVELLKGMGAKTAKSLPPELLDDTPEALPAPELDEVV